MPAEVMHRLQQVPVEWQVLARSGQGTVTEFGGGAVTG